MLVVDDIACRITDVGLCVVVDAPFESLRFQEFIEDGFSPVTLHAVAHLEGVVQLIHTLLGCLALTHHRSNLLCHLSTHLLLFFRIFRHCLLHLIDGFEQWIDNLT